MQKRILYKCKNKLWDNPYYFQKVHLDKVTELIA